jgi:hypothetical protein
MSSPKDVYGMVAFFIHNVKYILTKSCIHNIGALLPLGQRKVPPEASKVPVS